MKSVAVFLNTVLAFATNFEFGSENDPASTPNAAEAIVSMLYFPKMSFNSKSSPALKKAICHDNGQFDLIPKFLLYFLSKCIIQSFGYFGNEGYHPLHFAGSKDGCKS